MAHPGPVAGYLPVTELEIARGAVIGPLADSSLPEAWNRPLARREARAAFEAALAPALQRSPCVVTFSGGRDSSAVLAVAVGLARRLGLPDPVALTRRWPAHPETDESSWQEMVVAHLGVTDWQRVDFAELDLVGPTCAPSLLQRGVLWPPLLHTWPPLLEMARGGAIIAGEGGDEVLDPVRCTGLRWLLADPRRVTNGDALRHTRRACAPRSIRLRSARRQLRGAGPPWLRAPHGAAFIDEMAQLEADEPFAWFAAVKRSVTDRSHAVGIHNFAVLGAEYGIDMYHPFLDPGFIRQCAAGAGRLGFPGRTAAMRAIFGDDLPDALLRRTSKVFTNRVVLGQSTRDLAQTWSGAGLSPDLVDAGVLRSRLGDEEVPATAALAVQAAWMADQPKAAP